MIIKEYNPSEGQYYSFTLQKDKNSLIKYRRILMDKLRLLLDIDESYSNQEIGETEEFNDMSQKDLVDHSEIYAYFSSSDVLHYTMNDYFITDEIVLDGYKSIPTNFYKASSGLTIRGYEQSLTEGIKSFLGESKIKIDQLWIAKSGKTQIRKLRGKGYKLTLSEGDFRKLGNLSWIGKNKGKLMAQNSIGNFLHNKFPNKSNFIEKEDNNLKKLFLSTLDDSLVKKFNNKELEKIEEFYQKILGKNIKKRAFVERNLLKIKEVTLKSIIDEFEINLNKRTLESTWQKFFEKNIFIFDSRYINFISKFNLKTGRKSEPDFLVYDIYGTVDIYEIKTPRTELLKYDNSHDNYYWGSDASKAISQLEKYIHHASESRLEIEQAIKKEKDQKVSIIRPKGILVIGERSQLKNQKMIDDLSVLRSSLKNIEIILYDEMFESLKNLKSATAQASNDKQEAN